MAAKSPSASLQLTLPPEAADSVAGLWQLPATVEAPGDGGEVLDESQAGGSSGGSSEPVLVAGRFMRQGEPDTLAVWQVSNQVRSCVLGDDLQHDMEQSG